MQQNIRILLRFTPLAILILGLSSLSYLVVQQLGRQSLNDPQLQIVRDAKVALLSGKQPVEIVGRDGIFDLGKSLRPFIAVYDNKGYILESNASVDGRPPQPPIGVFEHARTNAEHRVTWQPNSNTRIALVVERVPTESGMFVASGRNMQEVESRIDSMGKLILLATLVVLISTLFFFVLVERRLPYSHL